jgi:thioredoxin 1
MIEIKNKTDLFEQISDIELTLVDFGARWCGPCRVLSKILPQLETDVKIVTVDIDQHPELSSLYNVRSIPALVFFKNGIEIKREIGMHTAIELKKIITELRGTNDTSLEKVGPIGDNTNTST